MKWLLFDDYVVGRDDGLVKLFPNRIQTIQLHHRNSTIALNVLVLWVSNEISEQATVMLKLKCYAAIWLTLSQVNARTMIALTITHWLLHWASNHLFRCQPTIFAGTREKYFLVVIVLHGNTYRIDKCHFLLAEKKKPRQQKLCIFITQSFSCNRFTFASTVPFAVLLKFNFIHIIDAEQFSMLIVS